MRRIDRKDALDLLNNYDLKELGRLAFERKRELHPDRITTFIIDRNINYTNTCWVGCKFCAFYKKKGEDGSYLLSFEEIGKKIEELLDIGGTQILFQGGVHPNLKIKWYEELLDFIHTNYPTITIHGFSAIEIEYISKVSGISTLEVLKRLQKKGLYSMPGAGAEILSDNVRKIISPKKTDSKTWLNIHREAHSIGVKTTATMMFGTVESYDDIIDHWEKIRELQDESGGFRAFILWSFQGKNTRLMKEYPTIQKHSSNSYLRLLATSRLFLDNFKNIQSSWVTQGSYIGQLALMFGANDLGSTMMEENVVKAAGASFRMNTEQMIELIKDVGEIPAKRNTNYDILEIYR